MNTFSQKITANEAEQIKDILVNLNADFDIVQYSYWRAKTSEFQVIYYTSGKILIQGKDITNISEKISKILNLTIDKANNTELANLYDKYIGTDESGKGDFFGPLVIAGVQADNLNKQKFIDLGIKDSKKLTDKKIIEFAAKIKANAVHSIVVITPVKYNELYDKFKNLNKLLAWGHARAIENILEKSPCTFAIADKFGDESLIQNALMNKGKEINLKQMVRAESDIAVAAASVLARAEFVKRMEELQNKYEIPFQKGVSEKVINQAKDFVEKYSYSRLNEVAKLHFKTTKEIKLSEKIFTIRNVSENF